jgi:hypothetical protein
LPVAAGAPAAGELVGAAVGAGAAGDVGEAGLGADGLQEVGAGSAACEEPKIAETSLPKMLMVSSSLMGSTRFPHTPMTACVHNNGRDPAMFRSGTCGRNSRRITGE